ncbi:DUF721 domain-containing protein [Roseomonas sp. BU-1]|uniref:DUF721 domain-containing protein n=1 Tax=Falsiroseomonas selenitidurans TaxID=2716335 RepID=A0ABX1E5Z0_9PROT|nr:DUF721 domain-containing protein [Falsiroseomonas selenitidurans]
MSALIPRLTRPAFRKRSPAGAMLMADWPQVVGPALAAVTQPVRLTAGSLTIACAGSVAMELQHLAPELMGRINAHLGRTAVERLRFVQQAPSGQPPPPPRPRAVPLPAELQARLGTLPEGPLREALAKLALGVYRKR